MKDLFDEVESVLNNFLGNVKCVCFEELWEEPEKCPPCIEREDIVFSIVNCVRGVIHKGHVIKLLKQVSRLNDLTVAEIMSFVNSFDGKKFELKSTSKLEKSKAWVKQTQPLLNRVLTPKAYEEDKSN